MLHLIKLAVGSQTPEDVVRFQAARRAAGGPLVVPTRQFPKRAAELTGGGSLFWVIAGLTGLRQPILAVRETTRPDGTRGTLIEVSPTLVPVSPRRVRAFQGWRYLPPDDAPADLGGPAVAGADALPPALRRALAELGLL